MIRILWAAVLLLPSFQDGTSQDQIIKGSIRDPEAGEYRAYFEGYGQGDLAKGTGRLSRMHVTFFTKSTARERSHTVHLFANRCEFEGVGEEAKGKGMFRFYDGLRVMLDDEVRLWTPEGTLDIDKQVLKCPKNTRLVQFDWTGQKSPASLLAFMDPQEVDWLKLFDAPEPVFELAGDEFEYDAAAYVFTAGKNGRLRVKGKPGATFGADRHEPKRAKKPANPTELRSEGPLVLRNLGASEPDGWTTLHITADRHVTVEHRATDNITRATGDAASLYVGLPPSSLKADPVSGKKPVSRVLSAALSGAVNIEESRGFGAACDRVEWNHQEDILRMTAAGRVELTQGGQKLQAKEVVADRTNRSIEFKGDIVATFRPGTDAAGGLMTLTPGDLKIRTDASGRPLGLHAFNGVRISGDQGIDAAGSEFEWDLVSGEGLLRGGPFARIEQGGNIVVAPLVTFQGESFDRSLMVVKGPKIMRFFNEASAPRVSSEPLDAPLGLPGFRAPVTEPSLNASATLLEAALGMPGLQAIPGRQESVMDLVITCDGDAVLDQVAGSVKLVDRCSVRAQDSTLFADRLFVVLAREGRELRLDRVLGYGNVRAHSTREALGGRLLIEGETLEFTMDPSGRNRSITIVGHPKVRLVRGTEEGEFEKVYFNLDSDPPGVKLWRGGGR